MTQQSNQIIKLQNNQIITLQNNQIRLPKLNSMFKVTSKLQT